MSDIEKQYDSAVPDAEKESDELGTQLESVDPVFEAKIVRKLDLFVIPVVMLLYLLSFLDRSVLGFSCLLHCFFDWSIGTKKHNF
jgi:hypothetical protein